MVFNNGGIDWGAPPSGPLEATGALDTEGGAGDSLCELTAFAVWLRWPFTVKPLHSSVPFSATLSSCRLPTPDQLRDPEDPVDSVLITASSLCPSPSVKVM